LRASVVQAAVTQSSDKYDLDRSASTEISRGIRLFVQMSQLAAELSEGVTSPNVVLSGAVFSRCVKVRKDGAKIYLG